MENIQNLMDFPQKDFVTLCLTCNLKFLRDTKLIVLTLFSKESSSITSQVPKHQATLFLQLPVQLNFKFDNTLVDEINASFQRFQDLAKTFQMKALEWKNYGSSFIKQNKLSPDAFVQMVLQLAVYKVYGKIFATYESASTKRFLCGRTETGRSVSISSKNWIKGMTNPNLSKAEKLNLFKEACDSHSNYMRNAGLILKF